MSLANDVIYRNKFRRVNTTQYTSINAHSYKVVMYLQKLHHFCKTTSHGDGLGLARKYLEKN